MEPKAPKLEDGRIAAALAKGRDAGEVRPKRFFTTASVLEADGGSAIVLDGRPARTPARRPLVLPTRAAADAVAAEWNALGDTIDPAALPLTRIVNAALDGVSSQAGAVLEEVVNYAGSDLLLYRAAEPAALAAEQAARWDPVLDWARDTFGARFRFVEGVMPVAQPPATVSILRQVLAEAVGDDAGAAFRLAALNVMTTLTGSALLALAVQRRRLSVEDAWAAAHVDEMFQERQWGEDAEALARRAARWREMQAAALLGGLA